MPWSRTSVALAIGVSSLAIARAVLAADTAEPPTEVTIIGTGLSEAASTAVLPVTFLGRDQLENQPSLRLDEVLGQIPGVSLFRRASSRSAHPTTQGVTLRGFGPNGAGRTLVILDGVPVNDPFGGWVPWTALSSLSLGEAVVVEGGGAGAWGNQALAGVIELKSEPRSTVWGEVRGGTRATFEGGGGGRADLGAADIVVEGGGSRTDGFYLLGATQRGPVDVRAASHDWHGSMRLTVPLDEDTKIHATVRHFEEDRVNGLDLATNGTRGWDGSLRFVRDVPGGTSFETTAYWKDRSFNSTFASVDDTRSSSQQVLNQYAVPSTGLGLNSVLRFDVGADTQLEFGIDLRHDQGKTHELFRNLGAGFLSERRAGGEELLGGGYAEITGNLSGVTVTASGRLDYWKISNGEILEFDLADNAIRRNDAIQDRSGWVANGRLGIRAPLDDENALTAAAYTGFRVPTINELFRPFRVGNDITDANPDLRPERLYGVNVGLTHDGEYVSASLDVFRLWLDNGIGNVTIGMGPGVFPPVGFVPAGGTLRQRQNIPGIDSKGAEAAVTFRPMESLAISLRYLYTDSSIGDAGAATDLQDKQLTGSPKSQGSVAIEGDITDRLHAMADLRFSSAQFDDDLNTRRLGGIATVDAALQYRVTKGVALTVSGENIFNEKVVSALSADGLETLANQRLVMAGMRVTY